MRILLLSLLCAMNLLAAGTGIINDHQGNVSKITHWLQDNTRKSKFCGRGTLFGDKTIRSNQGAKCKELIGAALANEVCDGYKGTFSNYNDSECKKNADNTIRQLGEGRINSQILIDKLAGNGLTEICKFIQYVFPKAKCEYELGEVKITEE